MCRWTVHRALRLKVGKMSGDNALPAATTAEQAEFTPEFQGRIDAAIRSCRAQEADGFHGYAERDPASAAFIAELASLLRDAYTHNLAWRKRAHEAEAALLPAPAVPAPADA